MNTSLKLALNALIAVAFATLCACGQTETASNNAVKDDAELTYKGLKTAAAFADIKDDEARALAVYDEMMNVLGHPRCVNCHGAEGPRQGDDMQPHNPPMVRGFGFGALAMSCDTCHGAENVTLASMEGSIPGADPWMLAPETMSLFGKSAAVICEQIKNPDLNGGRTPEDLIKHVGQDHLVHWAWHPGEGRTPAPGSAEVFGDLMSTWVSAGAHCPPETEAG